MGVSRVPSMVVVSFLSVVPSEGWSPDANEIFLDLGFLGVLRGDKGNRKAGGKGVMRTCPS
jgi:hypothetical protein